MAGEGSSHCNFFTESINKLIPFKRGVHLHGTVLEAGMRKCLQCREKTGLLFSFKDKTRKEMRETTFPTNPLILQCEGISAFHLIWYLWKLLMSRNMHLSSLILALTFPSCRETSVDTQELATAQLHCWMNVAQSTVSWYALKFWGNLVVPSDKTGPGLYLFPVTAY